MARQFAARRVVARLLILLPLVSPPAPARAAEDAGKVAQLSAPGPVTALAFAPDGHALAAAGQERREVRLWDAKTGRPLHTLTHVGSVRGLAWSPDGHTLGSACSDGAVYLWDCAAGRERRKP